MILADLGAEVIKIERQGVGDVARGNGPFVNDVSTYFLSLNRGKKSVTLDLSQEQGREIFLKLVEKSDILVENYVPGTMESFGLGYESVKARNPGIIYVAGSGFGQTGPYANKPAFDVIIQAMGGVLSITGEPGGPPIRPGVSYGDIAAGLFLCISTLAALREREKSGFGQLVDIAMLDCQITVQENAFVRYLNTGEIPQPLGTRHPVITPFQVFPTKDGYVSVALRGGIKNQWPLYCAAIDRLDIMDDPKFETGWLRTQNYKILEPILNEAMKNKTTKEWVEELEKLGIPCGPVNKIDQVANDKHVQARGMFLDIEHPRAGNLKVVNTPFKFSRTPIKPSKPAPDLGQDNEAILSSLLGLNQTDIDQLKISKII
jgi:CoA:oxalate CoA-transferase